MPAPVAAAAASSVAKAAASKKVRRRVALGCLGALVVPVVVVVALLAGIVAGIHVVFGGFDESEGLASAPAATEPAGGGSGGGSGPGAWGGHANGRIPASELCPLGVRPVLRARCDATAALERLNAAYVARFGTDISVTDAYRDYDAQVRVKAAKGNLAATPGTSNHGWGLALDLGGGINRFGTAQHLWMRENAAAYGWHLPGWALAGGSKPEPWHWEYSGTTP